jgi:hypothetical protein
MVLSGAGQEVQPTLAIPASSLGVNLAGTYDVPPQPAANGLPGHPGSAAVAYASTVPAPALSGPTAERPVGLVPPMGGQEMDETRAGRATTLGDHRRHAPTPNYIVPALLGVAVLILIGGGATAWVVMGRKADAGSAPAKSETATAAATGSASTAAAAPEAPAMGASAATSASAAPSATDTGPVTAAEVDAGPRPADVTLSCDPDCDELKVDGNPFEANKPLQLPPGKHVAIASKSGYVSVKETLDVKAGDKVEKTFKLMAKPSIVAVPVLAPTPNQTPAPSKPCSKWLKHCK